MTIKLYISDKRTGEDPRDKLELSYAVNEACTLLERKGYDVTYILEEVR